MTEYENIELIAQDGRWHIVDKASGKSVYSGASKYYVKQRMPAYASNSGPSKADQMFSIDQRFTFTEQLVRMVADKQTPSAIVTGEGGLGKTYTVIEALKNAGYEDITEFDVDEGEAAQSTGHKFYRVVKGFSTAKGLFRILYENRNIVLVFDDCDSVLKDADATNLLKGALDSYDKRLITWNSDTGDDLPRVFEFTGGVIFISNLPQERIDFAIRTRAMCVDLQMTTDQKIERMATIARSDKFLPEMPVAFKFEALELLNEHRDDANELSLRSLISVAKIRNSGNDNWKDLATYMLIN